MLRYLVLLLVNFKLFSQNFSIEGIVYDKKTKETLPGASIIIEKTTIGTSTNVDGKFCLANLKKGTYNLIVSYVGYKTDTIRNLHVKNNISNLELGLEENAYNLSEVNVVAERKKDVESSVINEIKESQQVVNGISAEQISKTQDKSANEVIKRLPGVTLFENRLLIVRGLAERYNSTYINNSPAPGVEPDKNTFSFDIIPSSIISRIMVYKTATPDLPGNFTGALTKIETKNNVDSNLYCFTVSSTYNSITTFNSFSYDKNSLLENLMLVRNSRNLSSEIPQSLNNLSKEELINVSKKFKNNWKIMQKTASPDLSFSFYFSQNVKKLSLFTLIALSESKQKYNSQIFNYNSYDIEKQKSQMIYAYNDDINVSKHRLTIMQNLSYTINAKNFIKLNNLLISQNSNQLINRSGTNYEEGMNVMSHSYNYNERKILNSQISGRHIIDGNENLETTWSAFLTLATNNQPDYKKIRTIKNSESTENSGTYQVIIPPSASVLDAGRFFGFLKDLSYGACSELKYSLKSNIKLQWGVGVSHKDRSFNARWMSYKKFSSTTFNYELLNNSIENIFDEQNIGEHGFVLEEGTNPSDKYFANTNNIFNYYMTNIEIKDKMPIVVGIRLEYNAISLFSRNYSNKPVNVSLNNLFLLPSMSFAYKLNNDKKIKFAFYKSVNTPEFRELAPFAFYDFRYNNVLIGNENLLPAKIYNADLKYEIITTNNNLFSVGSFYKYFINPIELYYVPGAGSGGTRNFTFSNANSAYNFGFETELRQNMTEIFNTNKVFNNLYFVTNFSYIYSKVSLGEKSVGQKSTRPLMFQSPYVLNLGLFYENKANNWQFNVVYYILGKRLYAVGTYGTPDIYELPRNDLNVSVTKKINKNSKVIISLYNLFNDNFILKQDSNDNGRIDRNDEIIEKYKIGQSVSVTYSIVF
ncbi:MAG: TonB-dependent receptor [Bacteroidales bacterium]|nr:TonB-dependent receptor [Bacteroidales bacterium]